MTPEAPVPLIRALQFANPELLREALTHRSALPVQNRRGRKQKAAAEEAQSNERLEFIGDRVLGLVIAEWLAERFPYEQEGQLGPRLAQLVSRPVLAGVARRTGLPDTLAIAPHEIRAGVAQSATVLADAMEAVIGALYLDAGLDRVREFIRACWREAITAQHRPPKDAKTGLQEWLLARRQPLPSYVVTVCEGPSHAPAYTITVTAMGQTGTGQAGSKREAERLAAADLLERLA